VAIYTKNVFKVPHFTQICIFKRNNYIHWMDTKCYTSLLIIVSMKQFITILIFTIVVGINSLSAQTVYITKSGTKYHSSSCRYASSGWAVQLQEALDKGLSPCSKCDPQTEVTSTSKEKPSSVKPRSNSTKTSSGKTQCGGTTKSGSQCKRMVSDGSGYCYQHK